MLAAALSRRRRTCMKEFKCKDAGHSCDFKAQGNSDSDVLEQAKEHGRSTHGMKEQEMTDEKIRPLIHDIA